MNCYYCNLSVIGDPKYHEVYENGKLVGHRHRRCVSNNSLSNTCCVNPTMTPKVSVIIPLYNTERFIKSCLDSVISQTYPNIEIIVVDDGSTDNSIDVVKQYGDKIKLILKANGGPASALNLGIMASKGEWIKWVSADDVLTNDAIEVLIKNALQVPDHKNCIFYTDYWYIDEYGSITGEFLERNHNDRTQQERNQTLWNWFYGNGSSSLIHRSIFDKCGMYDSTLPASEDYEFWLRACMVYGVRLYLIQKKTLMYRRHVGQLTNKIGAVYDSLIKQKIKKMCEDSSLPWIA